MSHEEKEYESHIINPVDYNISKSQKVYKFMFKVSLIYILVSLKGSYYAFSL